MCPKTVIRVLETTEDTLQYSFGGKGVRSMAARSKTAESSAAAAMCPLSSFYVRKTGERESGKSLEGMNNLSITFTIFATFLSLEVDRQLV